MNVNGRRDRKVSTSSIKSKSLLDLDKEIGHAILKEYAAEELGSLLNTCGKNWNFDIWFVYDTTGHSVSIIGKFLMERLCLTESF